MNEKGNSAKTINLPLTPLDADTIYETLAGQSARAEAIALTKLNDREHDPDEVRALKQEAARYQDLLEQVGGAICQERMDAQQALRARADRADVPGVRA